MIFRKLHVSSNHLITHNTSYLLVHHAPSVGFCPTCKTATTASIIGAYRVALANLLTITTRPKGLPVVLFLPRGVDVNETSGLSRVQKLRLINTFLPISINECNVLRTSYTCVQATTVIIDGCKALCFT